MTVRSGPWDPAEVAEYLDAAVIPIRLATQGDEYPIVQSLWYLRADDVLWCCTQEDSVLARRLGREPRCGFEIAEEDPPYRGVRGTGHATLHREQASTVLDRLIDRYGQSDTALARWLASRVATEVAVRIEPVALWCWDYSARMSADPQRESGG